MTRKHFRELADVLQREHQHACTAREHWIIDHVTEELADVCKRENRAFDRSRFLDAADHRGGSRGHVAGVRDAA